MQVQATLLFAVAALAYALPASEAPHRPTTAYPPAAGQHAHNSAHHAYEATAEGAQAALDVARPVGVVAAESGKYGFGKVGAGFRNIGSNLAASASYISRPVAVASAKTHNYLVGTSNRQIALGDQNRAYSQQAAANLKGIGADVTDSVRDTTNAAVDGATDAVHRASEKVKEVASRANNQIQESTDHARHEAKAKTNAARDQAHADAERSRAAADEAVARADAEGVSTGQGIVQNVKDAGSNLAAKFHKGNAKVARKTAEGAEAVRESADQTADNEEARAADASTPTVVVGNGASSLPLASAAVIAALSAASLLL